MDDHGQATAVYKIWEHWCPCGAGRCFSSDCSGPPGIGQRVNVHQWLDTGAVGECPVDTFPRRELWDWVIENEECY